MEATAERFLQQVEIVPWSGCWIWTGALSEKGYGRFCGQRAHRASWTIFKGTIPDGLNVLHRCDIRCCVNPAHLFLGTQRDNIRDALAKGRLRIPAVNLSRKPRALKPLGECACVYAQRNRCSRCQTLYMRAWRAQQQKIGPLEAA